MPLRPPDPDADAFRRKTIDYLLTQVQVLGGPPEGEEAPVVDDGSDAFEGHDAEALIAGAAGEGAPSDTDEAADES